MRAPALVAALAIVSGPLHAVEPPSPGDVRRSLPPTAPRAEQPARNVDVEQPQSTTVAPADSRRVLVKAFVLTGNTVLPESRVEAVLGAWSGQKLTLAEIYAVADHLTAIYHKAGYSLAQVTVPAQKVNEGVIRLRVVEGVLNKVVVEGETSYPESFLHEQVDTLRPGEILQFGNLERELLLLNDMPGLSARAVIRPGEAPGSSDLHLLTSEERFEGQLVVDNHGRDMIGEWRSTVSAALNNPGGRGDQLSGSVTRSEAGLVTAGALGYSLPLGHDGARLSASISRVAYGVGGQLAALDIDGESTSGRIGVSYPWKRSRRGDIAFTAAVSYAEGEQTVTGLPMITDAPITLLELGITARRVYPNGAFGQLAVQASGNFRDYEMRSDGSHNAGQPLLLLIDGSYEQPFADNWSGYGRLMLAGGLDPLHDTQRISLGGPSSVRGFPTSQASGDEGGLITVEARRLFRSPAGTGLFRAFVDAGEVRCDDFACANGSFSETLSSAGVGVALLIAERYSVDLQWARRINDHLVDGKDEDDGLTWFSVSARF